MPPRLPVPPTQWSRRVAEPASATQIDAAWLRDHPLPVHGEGTDKDSRGHVVAIGGSRGVPGGLLLTGEAALRAGAGKVQLATIESCAIALGIAFPEAGILALGEGDDGEIDPDGIVCLSHTLELCDSVVIGPAIGSPERAGAILHALFAKLLDRQHVVIDAVAIHAIRERAETLRTYRGELVVTPNPDELASLLACADSELATDPAGSAKKAADFLQAVIVHKGGESFVASPDGEVLHYQGGGVGLATGGSGDVLAGLIAALMARGSEPFVAAAWGVWLHGEAGKRMTASMGPIGFFARELSSQVPALMQAPRLSRSLHQLATQVADVDAEQPQRS